ncbi:MAG: hypothetical protein RIQ56_447, partial [Candidatus Parcubacteria bacterium]
MTNQTDIEVLKEMVRLAENRRTEEFRAIERLNQYNLALIAFSGAFLSLLVTANFEVLTVQLSGLALLISISISLLTIRPRTLKGAVLTVDEDVRAIQRGEKLLLNDYLIETAYLLDSAASKAGQRAA